MKVRAITLLAALSACHDFGTALDRCVDAGGCTTGVAISPSTLVLAVGNTFTFTASEGLEPYVFSVVGGEGTIEAASGLFTASSTPGAASVRVTDAIGHTADAVVTVNAALTLSPANRTLGAATGFRFTAAGGVTPYAFSIASGQGSIDAQSGDYVAGLSPGRERVRVTDLRANTAEAEVTVVEPLVIDPAMKTIAVGNTIPFAADGGVPPYSFSLFAGTGTVATSGLFTSSNAPGSVTVRVTDSVQGTADAVVTVNPPLQIVPASATVTLGGAGLIFSAADGAPPYTFFAGDGGVVNAVTGDFAPSRAGVTSVRVADDAGNTSIATVTVLDVFSSSVRFDLDDAGSLGFAVGDWNRDGLADLAVTLRSRDTVAILLGGDGGSMVVAGRFDAGTDPSGVAAGDFDRDGILDLAVTNYVSAQVTVMRGVGDGTFSSPRAYATAAGFAIEPVVGDWNRDGIPDLALATQGAVSMSALLGVGDGTFQPATAVDAGGHHIAVAVGDWNRDRRADLITSNYFSGDLTMMIGAGTGGFAEPRALDAGAAPHPRAVAEGDWNRDGLPDLAVVNDSGSVSLLAGDGAGGFQPPRISGVGGFPVASAVADWNRDGRLDLAVPNLGYLSPLFGGGDGTLRLSAGILSPGLNPSQALAADFDRNGKPDLAVLAAAGRVHLHLNQAQPLVQLSFGAPVALPVGAGTIGLAAADLNRDGKPDLAVSSRINATTGTVSILYGVGDGTFAPPLNLQARGTPFGLAVDDWNRDGTTDLAVSNSLSNDVSVFTGAGDGGFLGAVNYGVGLTPESLVVGDWNRDGVPDLAVGHLVSHFVSILAGVGDGTFRTPVNFPTPDAGFRSLAVADFNRDGVLDLAAAADFITGVLYGQSDGGFQPVVNLTTARGGAGATAGDWNRDGRPDFATASFGLGTASVWSAQPDGGFQGRFPAAHVGPRAIVSADWNDDGYDDLAVGATGADAGALTLLLNDRLGGFPVGIEYDAGTYVNPRAIAAADFDGDGRVDFAYILPNGSAVFTVRNTSR